MLTYVVLELDYGASDYSVRYCGIDYKKALEVYDNIVNEDYPETTVRKETWKDGEFLSAIFREN